MDNQLFILIPDIDDIPGPQDAESSIFSQFFPRGEYHGYKKECETVLQNLPF
jgi:hypothetical protein